MSWIIAGVLFGIGLILAPLALELAVWGFVIAAIGSLVIVIVVFAVANPGLALCVGVVLLAWIGWRWLDHRDALVEWEAMERRRMEGNRREQEEWDRKWDRVRGRPELIDDDFIEELEALPPRHPSPPIKPAD
jgi:membrane protein implicated in regulation of membrane protease activity